MSTKRTITPVFVYVVLVLLFLLIGLNVLDWSHYRNLAKKAVKITGHVISKEPENHRFVRYSFDLDSRSYTGIGNAGGENHEFDQLRLNDPVVVYYDPDDPNNSFLGNPKRQFESATTGLIFMILFGPAVCMFGLYRSGWLFKRP